MTVKKEDGAQGLVLRGSRYFFIRYEVGEKLIYPSTSSGRRFRRAHFFGMALIVEEDKFLRPLDVGIAGARGVMFEVDDVAVAVEKFFLLRGPGYRNFRRWGRFGWVLLCHFVACFEVAGL